MSFGLVGASGSGKTTLAKDVATRMNIPYHDAGTTRLMNAAGYNPVDIPGLDGRFDAQEKLLDAYLAEVRTLPRPFITDRTPIDMAAYLLGEITMTNATEEQGVRAAAYVERCLRATEAMFDAFLIVPPLPSYDAQPTRPPPNKAYQKKFHAIVTGLIADQADPRDFAWGVVNTNDRERRAIATADFFRNRITQWAERRKECRAH